MKLLYIFYNEIFFTHYAYIFYRINIQNCYIVSINIMRTSIRLYYISGICTKKIMYKDKKKFAYFFPEKINYV